MLPQIFNINSDSLIWNRSVWWNTFVWNSLNSFSLYSIYSQKICIKLRKYETQMQEKCKFLPDNVLELKTTKWYEK